MTKRILHWLLAIAAPLAMLASGAAAAAYPERPIRLIVTFVPGGGADLLARYLAKALSEDMGQPVIVENRPGAGGMIGVEAGRNTKPDGYTLTLISSSYTVNRALLTPEAHAKLQADGAEPAGGSAAAFTATIRTGITQWAGIVDELGIKPE